MPDIQQQDDTQLHSPNQERRTLPSTAHAIFTHANALPARAIDYVRTVITDFSSWPQRKAGDRERISHIAIAATVAPAHVKKDLLHAARIRNGALWLVILIAIYLVSIIGSAFSWVHVTNIIGSSLTLIVICRLAIESAKKATKNLLRFIEEDDPDNATNISPATFEVSYAMALAPWIKNKNGLLTRLLNFLRRKIEAYFGITRKHSGT